MCVLSRCKAVEIVTLYPFKTSANVTAVASYRVVKNQCKMGVTSLRRNTTPTVRDISTFAFLCSITRPFLSLYF